MRKETLILGVLLLWLTQGCGSGINGGPGVGVNFINSNLSGTSGFYFENFKFQPGDFFKVGDFSLGESLGMFAAGDYGSGAPEKFAYAIQRVSVCTTLTPTGSGYQLDGNSSCSLLYSTKYTQEDYDNNNVTSPYLDMMSMSETRATLTQNLAISPGTYNYGLIDWFKPIKVKGSVTLGDGSKLYTKAGGTQTADYYQASSLATGPAEEATILMNNGGAWIKFQNPWVYDGKETVTLDLVFNPDHLLKGAKSAASYYTIRDSSTGAGINTPFLKLTPVVHKTSEVAMKEVYRFDFTTYDVYIELYYVDTDSQKAIYGVHTVSAAKASTSDSIQDPPSAFSVQTNGDGTIGLLDYENKEFVRFARKTTEGQTGTSTWGWGSSPTANYTLMKIAAVR